MTRLTREEWEAEVAAIKAATGAPKAYIEQILTAMCARGWKPGKKNDNDAGEDQSG